MFMPLKARSRSRWPSSAKRWNWKRGNERGASDDSTAALGTNSALVITKENAA